LVVAAGALTLLTLANLLDDERGEQPNLLGREWCCDEVTVLEAR
jgi:hypothetical protein